MKCAAAKLAFLSAWNAAPQFFVVLLAALRIRQRFNNRIQPAHLRFGQLLHRLIRLLIRMQ
jgi:hypothetical protein